MANLVVNLEVSFSAVLPDDPMEADKAADTIGDDIVAALNRQSFTNGVIDGSFAVEDWNDRPAEEG